MIKRLKVLARTLNRLDSRRNSSMVNRIISLASEFDEDDYSNDYEMVDEHDKDDKYPLTDKIQEAISNQLDKYIKYHVQRYGYGADGYSPLKITSMNWGSYGELDGKPSDDGGAGEDFGNIVVNTVDDFGKSDVWLFWKVYPGDYGYNYASPIKGEPEARMFGES